MDDRDRDLESELRRALHEEVSDLRVHLTGADLRARARPARPFWQILAAPLAAAAAIALAAVIGWMVLRLPPTSQVSGTPSAPVIGTPTVTAVQGSPSPSGAPASGASPSGGPSGSVEPTGGPSSSPSTTPSATVGGARAPLAGPGQAIVTHRVAGALQVDVLARDGDLTPVATIPGFAEHLAGRVVGGISTSRDGYLAVWENAPAAAAETFVYDLYDPTAAPRLLERATGADFGPTGVLAVSAPGGTDLIDPGTGERTHIAGVEYPMRGWLVDATGFLVSDRNPDVTANVPTSGSRILRLDGTVEPVAGSIPPLQPADGGVRIAPDAERAAGANGEQITLACHDGPPDPAGNPTQADCIATVVDATGANPAVWGPPDSGRARWDAGGTGLWFANGPFRYEGAGTVKLEHFATPTARDRLIETGTTSGVDFVKVDYAPDDSFALFRLEDGRLTLFDLATAKPSTDVCGCSPVREIGTAGADWRLAGWTEFPAYPIAGYTPPAAR